MQPSLLAEARKYAAFCVVVLSLLILPALLNAQVVLNDYTQPSVAQAGVQSVKLTGTGFPNESIDASRVSIVLTPASGPSVSTTPLTVTSVSGDATLRFLVPSSIVVTSPTLYTVTVSGKSISGITFTTSFPSKITVNPAASIVLSPNQASSGTELWVNIAGTLTDFAQNGTFANFGPGISVGNGAFGQTGLVDVSTVIVAKAFVQIDDTAAPGTRNVVVNTGPQQASASFLVLAPYQPPTADAGPQQLVAVGTSVQLDGSRSTSPAGNPLTFSWSLTSVPAGSRAALSNSAIVNPTFVADVFGQYTAQLTVSDGVSSTSASVLITTSNTAPVASAGPDQTVAAGSVVTLDGSGSSDVDGDTLTYAWTLKQKPQGSTAQLSSSTLITPTFVADVPGTYIAELTVNDGHGHSATKSVSVSTSNQPPLVNPGTNQTIPVDSLVQLDGSASSDPDGDNLSYAWTFTFRPAGSSAVLNADSSAFPTFTPDVRGNYVVQLSVDDGHGHVSSSTVTVSTANSAPISNAGQPQNVPIGATVALDGSGAYDPDGSSLFYTWSLIARPAGSTAALSSTSVVAPTFVADIAGQYVAQLIVSDGTLLSSPTTVLITAAGSGMSVNPPSIDFGVQSVARTITRSITITNTGGTPLQITGVTVAGSPQFQTTNAAMPTVVAPGASTTVNVAYAPTTEGAQNADVVISTTATPQTTVPLVAAAVSSPSISLSTSSIDFGGQTVGKSSSVQKITIFNAGPGDFTISNLSFGGSASQDYSAVIENSSVALMQRPTRGESASLATAQNPPIPQGSSVVLDVTFTPSAPGPRPATFIITDNANGSPHVVFLSGSGLASAVTFNPTSVAFANQALNTTSAPQTLNLKNTGTSTLTVTGVTLQGANSAEFAITGAATPFTVAAGATKAITLTFTPVAPGTRSATLSFTDDAAGSPQTVNITGTGAATPDITVQPLAIDFSTVTLGTPKSYPVVISNPGSGTLNVTGLAISGTNAADFTASPQTLPLSIQPGGSASIPITFAPSALGSRSAILTIAHNANGSAIQVTLTGSGSSQPNPISPTSLDFGSQAVNSTSADKTVTFTNYSSSSATISSVTVTGAAAGDFSVTGGPTPINVGANNGTANFTVKFTPTAQGTRTATLVIADTLPNSPRSIPLVGNGTQANITVAPTSITFPNQQKTTTSAAQTITVSNSGTGDLVISNIALSGTNATEFAVTPNTFPITVAPNSSKQFSVTFTPADVGSRSATLTISHNVAPGSSTVSLTGTGQNVATTILINPTSLDFGSIVPNVVSTPKFVNVTNNGGTNLVITQITITGANASEFAVNAPAMPLTVSPFSTMSISVTANPAGVGARSATLSFSDNAAGSPHTVALFATGKGTPAFSASPVPVDFGKQNVGTVSAPLSLTISNPGTDNLVITALSFTGTNATDFTVTPASGLPITVQPNGNTVLTLKFTPPTSGVRSATLRVTTNTTGSPNQISITGTGTTPVFTPTAPGDFGSVPNGTTSAAKTAVLANTGTGVLTISALSIIGANASDFALVAPPALPIVIQPGSNVSLNVTFTPSSTGNRAASISVVDDAAGSPHSIALTGTGIAAGPAVSFSPSPMAFGNQPLNQATAATNLTVSNTGNQTLNISNIQLTGANSGDFTVVPPTLPATVSAGGSIVLQLTFKPTALGARAAQLIFTDNAAGGTQTVSLSGTGTSGVLSVNPTTLAFGDQSVGTASMGKQVTVSNTGSQTITVTSLQISGTNANVFSLLNAPALPAAIGAGGSILFNVVFTPNSVASGLTATLTVGSSNGGSVPVAISGNGVQTSGANVTFNAASISFPSTNVNTSATAKPLIINSTGSGNLNISSITITGANAGDFSFTGPTPPFTVSPQSSMVLSVGFKPTDFGTRSATLTITDNGPGSPHTIALSGTGSITGPAIRLNPTSFAFGTQPVNVQTASQPLTITNPGTTALSITALSFAGANPSDFSFGSVSLPLSVAAGGTTTLNLTFKPTAEGSRSATLNFTDNAPSSPLHSVTVGGSGLSPKATLAPLSQSFGAIDVGQSSAPVAFTITNTGTSNVVVTNIASDTTAFQISSATLPLTIAPGNNAAFNVTFAPTRPGVFNGTLTVTSNAPTLTSSLTGTAPGGVFTIAPTSLDFGTQTVGTPSTPRTVAITNTGSTTLTLSSKVSGTNASSYVISIPANALPIDIQPGQSYQFTVAFNPIGNGTFPNTLSFIDSAPGGNAGLGGPHSITFTGNGILPIIAAAMEPTTFPDQAINVTSAPANLRISNSGTADLVVSSITLGGANPGVFQMGSVSLPLTIPAGTSTTIPVTFTPTSFQTFNASISILNNAAGTPTVVLLSGKGLATPGLTYLPTSGLTFTSQVINTTSAPQTINLGNNGTGTLTISSLALSGPNAADFTISSAPNLPMSISPNSAQVSVQITYKPTVIASSTASLVITSNMASSPTSIPLAGTGVGTPKIQVPSTMSFGNQLVTTQSAITPLTINNPGSADLVISNITVSGTNPGDFSITTGTLPIVVTAGNSVSLDTKFTPAALGARSAIINITHNGTNVASPSMINLSGTGTQAVIGFNPPSGLSQNTVSFGSVVAGTTGNVSLVIGNTGTADLLINALTITGAQAADFSYGTLTFPITIVPNAQKTITLSFNPKGNGQRTATLTFSDNGQGNPHSITLSGQGLAPTIGITPSTQPIDFGTALVNATVSKTISISNSGNGPLNVSSLTITGANPGDYTISGITAPFVVQQSVTVPLTVTFKPTAAGTRSASLNIISNSPTTPDSVALTGIGQTQVKVDIAPSPVVFSNQTVGAPSSPVPVTLTSSGSADLVVSSITVSGAQASDFTATLANGQLPLTLTPGTTATVNVVFTPGAANARIANLIVASNAPTSPNSVALQGNAVGVPIAVFNPASVDFGNVKVGVTSAALPLTVNNSGSADLVVSAVTVSGTNAADFTLTGFVPPLVLHAGQSSTLNLTLRPGAKGLRTAQVNFTDNAQGSPHIVGIQGTGTSPDIAVTPSTWDFGSQAKGIPSTPKTFTINNPGTADLIVTAISAAGTNSTDFVVTPGSPLPMTIPAGSSNTFNIVFTPGAAGARTGSVNIIHNAAGSVTNVPFTGNGVVSAVTLTPPANSTLSFTGTVVGQTSAPQTVTIKNTGGGQLVVSNVTVQGAQAPEFTVTAALPISIDPGQSATISVKFSPASATPVTRTASMQFTDNAPDSPQFLQLSGSALKSKLTVDKTTIDFQNQNVGQASTAKTLTITNTGTADLKITALTLTGTNPGDFALTNNALPITLAPNANTVVSLTFTPAAKNSRTATLNIANDTDVNPVTVSLTGTGTAPTWASTPQPQSLSFPDQLVNQSSTGIPISITNSGTGNLVISNIAITGANASEFTFTAGTLPLTVLPAGQGNVTISAVFKPLSEGPKTANIVITANDDQTTHTYTLSGNGVAPQFSAAPTALTFDATNVGSNSAKQLVVTNNGTGNLVISSLTLTGTNASEFSFGSVTFPLTIAPGANRTFNITFAPQGANSRSATLTIADNAAGNPHAISLTGTGVAPQFSAPATLDFGGSASAKTLPLTINNTGNGNLVISAFTVTSTNNPPASEWTASVSPSTLPLTIAPNSNAVVNVTYTPAASGARTGTIQFTDNSAGNPHTVQLTATYTGPGVGLDKTSLDFGTVKPGNSSTPQSVKITNNGGSNLVITAITTTGTNPGDFLLVKPGLPATVTPGNFITVSAIFKPTATGSRSAQISIADNALNTPQTVTLTGTGQPNVTLVMPNLTVGKDLETLVTVGTNTPVSQDLVVTITSNDTNQALLSSSATAAGGASVTVTVPAGSSTGLPGFYVQGLSSSGSTTLTATATGVPTLNNVQVSFTPSGFTLSSPSGVGAPFTNILGNGDSTLAVSLVQLDANGNITDTSAKLRGGLGVTIPISATDIAPGVNIGTIVGSATLSGGSGITTGAVFHPINPGQSTLAITQPNGFLTPSPYVQNNVTVIPTTALATVRGPSLSMNPVLVGANLEVSAVGTLEAPAGAGGVQVTIASNNPALALLATNPLAAGSSSIVVTVPQGSIALPTFYVYGMAQGNTTLSMSATGYATAAGQVQVTGTGFVIAGPSGNPGEALATTTISKNSQLTVAVMRLDPAGNPATAGVIQGGISVSTNINTSNPLVGTISGNPITITAGNNSTTAAFVPGSQGSTTLTMAAVSGFSTPNSGGSLVVTVSQPQVQIFAGNGNIGSKLQIPGSGKLTGPAPSPNLQVTITSNNPAVVLTANPAGIGSTSLTLTVPSGSGVDGSGFPGFYIQAIGTAGNTATLTASAPGFQGSTANVTVTPAGFVLYSPNGIGADFGTIPSEGNTTLTVAAMQLASGTNAPVSQQAVVGGASVTITSSNASVGTISDSPASLPAGSQNATAHFTPGAAKGSTLLQITQPSGFTNPSTGASLNAVVN